MRQFSLRSMMVIVAAIAILLAYYPYAEYFGSGQPVTSDAGVVSSITLDNPSRVRRFLAVAGAECVVLGMWALFAWRGRQQQN